MEDIKNFLSKYKGAIKDEVKEKTKKFIDKM